MRAGGIWGQSPQPPKDGGLGAIPGGKSPALSAFCTFSIKITHFYAYFRQSYFKPIIHQLK